THPINFGILPIFFSPLFLPKEIRMTQTACIMVVSLFASGLCIAPLAIAAPAKPSKTAACNTQADDKGLGEGKDDERTAFMKECLSAKPAKASGAQQNKMKTCNKE